MNGSSPFYRTEDLDEALAYRVHRAARVLRRHLVTVLQQQELSIGPEQYFVLFKVHAMPGCSQNEVVDGLLGDHSNITRLVDGLERAGLLERRAAVGDRRKHALFLTAEGRAAMDRLLPAIVEERKALYAGMDERRLGDFLDTLSRLETNALARSGPDSSPSGAEEAT